VLREMEAERIELPSAILAARMLILTGCRLNEIMTLKWTYVDLAERVLRLPDSKSGAKVVHLGQPAVELLRDAQRIDGNPWVITGTLPGKRLNDLQPFWQRVRARAGVKDVRIHDLRHTFASTAVASGQGLPMIGKLLGIRRSRPRRATLISLPSRCGWRRTRWRRTSGNPWDNCAELGGCPRD
ncbi:MAG: site-specific integrase, partial [Hyphomicrobiaceae bacterium]|nr:site-specific integrase [Hyphomicrobiaceae bacterium]